MRKRHRIDDLMWRHIENIRNSECLVSGAKITAILNTSFLEKDLQFSTYALAYRQLYGEDGNGVRLDIMVRTKKPKIQQLSGKRNQQDIARFLRITKQVEQGIKGEVFYPNEGYMCGFCGYGEMCKEW